MPARYAGRRLPVRLAARTVEIHDGPTLVARHERAVGRYVEVLALDHYLEVLKSKPGALPGATALAQAKTCGVFTTSHQSYRDAARRVRGDAAGTRALIAVLLAHRSMPTAALAAAMAAVTSGCLDPETVLIDARRHTSALAPVVPIGALARYDRPPPTLTYYDYCSHREPIMTSTSKTTTADAAAQASIGAAARELHLPTVRTEAVRLAEIADRERQTHLRYLAKVLAAEVDDRTERRRTRRVNDAKFPRLKRLADFNIDAVAGIAPAILGQLAGGHYMDAGEPVVLLGDSGTGKSRPAHRARVGSLRTRPPGPLHHHRATGQRTRRSRRRTGPVCVVARYGRLDLLCLDELGYVQIDPRGAELLFQIITEREERASVAIATNLPFSKAHLFARTCAQCCRNSTGWGPCRIVACGEARLLFG